jgi:uncharacterized protein DUF2442
MDYDILDAQYRGGYTVWLRFRDGTAGEIDLKPALRGPVFEPLHDPAVFQQFSIHPEFQTLVWPNGADFAPEFLHDNVRVTA